MKDNYSSIEIRLRSFLEDEARSCSMDFGCVTPLYVYRMWGGSVSIDNITKALMRNNCIDLVTRVND